MTTLIDILKKETASLRAQYLELTEKWADASFKNLKDRVDWPLTKWYDLYDLKYKIVTRRVAHDHDEEYPELIKKEGSRYIYGKEYYQMENARNTTFKIAYNGYDNYLKKALKNAEDHYESSIIKLASRIEQKELNQEKLTVKTSHVGVNIDTVLTDGEKTVKAWTIIASGPIQKPHYRYLVK